MFLAGRRGEKDDAEGAKKTAEGSALDCEEENCRERHAFVCVSEGGFRGDGRGGGGGREGKRAAAAATNCMRETRGKMFVPARRFIALVVVG
jgi:hypothetical protein